MGQQLMSFNEFVPPQFGPVIDWRGGNCPVDPDTVVRFHYRDGRSGIGRAIPDDMRVPPAAQYVHLIWRHAPLPGRANPQRDIIAYQVASHG
jgi:hypothetical protein